MILGGTQIGQALSQLCPIFIILDLERKIDLKINNSNSTIKRKRSVENYLSSDDDDGLPCDFSTNSLKVNVLPERNGDKCARKLGKSYRNTGKMYYTAAGKIIRKKIFKDKDCHCLKNYINLINVEERKSIFDNFWNSRKFNKQYLTLDNLFNIIVKLNYFVC